MSLSSLSGKLEEISKPSMTSSPLTGTLEGQVEIKASAEMFFAMLCNRPHHVNKACSEKVQACELHEGDWGNQGSIICWSYVHDGEAKTGKELIEAIDPKNHSVTFRVIEGDLMEEFKSLVIRVQATPSPEGGGEGCVVHWGFEYESCMKALHIQRPYWIIYSMSLKIWVTISPKHNNNNNDDDDDDGRE